MQRLLAVASLIVLAIAASAADGDAPVPVVGPLSTPVSERWSDIVGRAAAGPRLATATPNAPRTKNRLVRSSPTIAGPSPRLALGGQSLFAPLTPGFASPFTVSGSASFATLDYTQTGGWRPPDTMGAIGPNHYVVTLNSEIGIYDRAGGSVSSASLDTFFASLSPINGEVDPHVIFDAGSQRWMVSAIELGPTSGGHDSDNDVLFAISATTDPTGIWTFYRVPVAVPNGGGTVVPGGTGHSYLNDYDSLGTDGNGVYFGMALFEDATVGLFSRIVAVEKSLVLAAQPFTPTIFDNLLDNFAVHQPARNADPIAAGGKAWFVDGSGTIVAAVTLRSLTWSGAAGSRVAALSAATSLSTQPCGFPVNPHSLNDGGVPVDGGDLRLLMATLRNNHIWTCRSAGVNAAGGATSVDRTGAQWLEIDVSGTPSIVQQGIVYDSSATPRSYFFPAVMVNGQGHAAMAFSGCKSSEFIGAYYCSRLASSSAGAMSDVAQLKAGEAKYAGPGSGVQRWGDYSHISLDPTDDMSIWTTQEYAKAPTASALWGTWSAQLLAPPPATPVSASPNFLPQGVTGVTVVVTATSSNGSAFFDAGAGHTAPTASFSGGGVTVTALTVDSATQATLTVDVAGGAAVGGRTLTFTNPDGQTATSASAILAIGTPPTVSLSLTGSPFAENGGVATVTADQSAASVVDTSVDVAFTGTATFGSDYVASSSTIIVPAGATSGSITLTGQDDMVADGGETAIVTVSTINGATAAGPQTVTATITDVVPPTVDLSLTGSPFSEHGGAATVTATLSRVSTRTVTVTVGYSGTVAAGRYSAPTQIVIPAGSLSGAIAITGVDDYTEQPDETVIVTVSGIANALPGTTQQVTATETSNDHPGEPHRCGIAGWFGLLLFAGGLGWRRQRRGGNRWHQPGR